jgi:hypothetical protein
MEVAGNENSDVTAETPEPETYSTRRADALAEIAETYMQTEPVPASTADRYQVVVHVTAETSPSQEVENAHIEGGPHVTAETYAGSPAIARWSAWLTEKTAKHCPSGDDPGPFRPR